MLLVEFVGHLHGIVHVNQLGDERGVVCMASPVNLSAFHHQEEPVSQALLLHEEVDAGASDVLQSEVVLRAVQGIGNRAAFNLAGLLGLEENHLVGLLGLLLIVLVAAGDGVATSLSLGIEVGTAIRILWLNEVAACEEVEA